METRVICFECGSEELYEWKIVSRKYEGEGYSFSMDVKVPFCKVCGAPITIEEIEEKIAEKANDKIRECKGIIKKEEITFLLETYHVSQKFLSRLLGWGEITLTRYVSGVYTPNQANSDKLKSLDDPYVFQELLLENIENTNGNIKKENNFKKSQIAVNRRIDELEKSVGKIYQVVNWFLAQSSEENPLTHLGLQKLLYFSQGWNKALNHNWLFQEDCEAWVHGAVYRNIYNEFKKFKYMSLPKVEKEVHLEKNELQILETVKKYYFDIYTAKTLENICHLEEPYKIAREGYRETENCEQMISKEHISAYYERIAKKYNITTDDTSNMKKYLNDLLT